MVAALARAVVAFQAVKLAGVVVNLVLFPTLRRQELAGRPETSALVPARDEGRRLPAALAGLRAQDVSEIIVLDDQSSDDTAAVVRRAAGTDPRVRLLPGTPLPSGWTGKNWACHQLAAAARGDILLFC